MEEDFIRGQSPKWSVMLETKEKKKKMTKKKKKKKKKKC
jgi:hypothetical protein